MDNKIDKNDVIKFYDNYVVRQQKVGINLRHYTIANYLKRAGLNKTSSVLEIGCGIGTLTGLLRRIANNGNIVATDISTASIKEAQNRLGPLKNVTFLVSDLTDLPLGQSFDFIVLADVLEHIPIVDHDQLFRRISRLMHNESRVVIHIPHPDKVKFVQHTNPELLQVIDQPLSSIELTPIFNKHGYIIHKYLPYSLFYKENDAVFIELHRREISEYHALSKMEIILRKTVNRIHYHLNSFK